MKEIKEALKTKIKELKLELSQAEKALAALETEKPAAKAKSSRAALPESSLATGSTTTAAKALADTVFNDGVLAQLKAVPNSSAEGVAGVMKVAKGKVNQAFKALVQKGDIVVSGKSGRTKLYSVTPTE